MKTVSEIIAHCDHVVSIVPGSCILSDEEWQTLKSAVLAQRQHINDYTAVIREELMQYLEDESPVLFEDIDLLKLAKRINYALQKTFDQNANNGKKK
jgi:hypothetical protein